MASLFKSAWNRLVGTPDKAAPAPAPAFRASVPAPAPVGNASIDNLPPATLGARRPLISAHNGVVGYEFRIGGELRARFRRSPDAKAQSAYAATVLTSARLTSKSGRLGLARLPVDWLVHKYDAEVAKGVMVALDRPNSGQSLAHDLQTLLQNLQAMRTAGAQIGWPIDLNIKLKRDFVLLRQGQQDIGEVLEQIKHWPTDVLGLPVVLTDVQHLEDVELALLDGVRYVCGAVAPREAVAPKDAQALAPEAQRIAQVLQQLVTGAETPAIVEQVKADVGLSYKLLRRLKTAEMAHLKDCASIDQAVQLLGRNELYRWLTMLLLKSPGNRKGGQALHEIALWRARLLELLAQHRKENAPGQLFTLGLASMLGPLLKLTPLDVVTTLSLSINGSQALLKETGPWAPYLQIARAIEMHQLDQSPELTDPFGGLAMVSDLSDQAWGWAADSVRFVQEDRDDEDD